MTAYHTATRMYRLRSRRQIDLYPLCRIWHPERFQGIRNKRDYFEGWYFKIVNRDKSQVYAIIPGIAIKALDHDAYAFIQVINGITGQTYFIRYRLDQFSYARQTFRIRIGRNIFSLDHMQLEIRDHELELTGAVQFKQLHRYPVRLFSPGVMGWYRFVPSMQCYHGILSMQHALTGALTVSGKKIDFTGGKGYMEKDWGTSMPIAWIWIQSNHFSEAERSISVSIAHIPWLRRAFTGFLIIVYDRGRLYRITNYNGGWVEGLQASATETSFRCGNRKINMTVRAKGAASGILKAPVSGAMSREIHESIGAGVHVKLTGQKDSLLFEDDGFPAGMEVAGDWQILVDHLS